MDAHGSFLQSREWGKLQENLGKRVLYFSDDCVSSVIFEQKLPFGKTYLYAPHGPVIHVARNGCLRSFADNARIRCGGKPIFIKIEPHPARGLDDAFLRREGFRKTASLQPEMTLLLDLKKDEKELMDGMEHATRYSIRTALKRGVSVRYASMESEKREFFEKFWELFVITNKRKGLRAYERKYYEEIVKLSGGCRSEVFLAEGEGAVLAAVIMVYFGSRATYLHAASRAGYGRLNAPTLLLWEAIRRAKMLKFDVFDFWGISREKKGWEKITAFKKSFGGREVSYVGTWDFPFDKAWYSLYRAAKYLRGSL
ncbi:MAG: peptidoglycan bridge formation glycyltransferase FemA/FemB family protein [bacterium]|nr:peptidoglycan bridge formation glycyltransferase FemA/FemB family protein [bacterium]